MAETMVRTRALVKSFGMARALDGFDLDVERGQVVGVLGGGGSGKTTLMRILLGLCKPDPGSGPAIVLGTNPRSEAIELHRRLAYVPGEVVLWPSMTGGETIDLLARLRGGIVPRRRDRLIEQFELDPSRRVRDYSRAERHKVALIVAFASRADLLLLDEPAIVLEPRAARALAARIHEARSVGRTVLLTSSNLGRIDPLCDLIHVIRDGRNVVTGPPAVLARLARPTIRLTAHSDPGHLASLTGVHDFTSRGLSARFTVDAEMLSEVMGAAAKGGMATLTCQGPTLDDILVQFPPDAEPAPAPFDHDGPR